MTDEEEFKRAAEKSGGPTKEAIEDMLHSIRHRFGPVPAYAAIRLGSVVQGLATGLVAMDKELPPFVKDMVVKKMDVAETSVKELMVLAVSQYIKEEDRHNFLEAVAAIVRRPLDDAMKYATTGGKK